MKKVLALVLALVMVLSLTACGEPKKEDIVGQWNVYDRVLTFHLDGTFSMSSTREGGAPSMSDLEAYKAYAQSIVSNGSWEINGNTVKAETDKYGFINFIYQDGKLIDGDDVYTKEDVKSD